MTIQDWGVTYDELERHYDFVEKVMGTSGRAYRINGQTTGDGNYFEANRSSDYPLPPQADHYTAHLFKIAARDVGFHPFSEPSANASRSYTNPYGCQMGPCTFCGFCSGYACCNYSKASPNVNILPALRREPRFELRSRCMVTRIDLDSSKQRATGVTYVDEHGNTVHQPANIVIASTFAYNNARLFLLSGVGTPYDPVANKGAVGRNIAYQTMSTVQMFFGPGKNTNMFIGAGGNGVAVDDFNGDNFDHAPLNFVGSAPV
jgi:gluconate 2-dehydrogenase alpha chain